MFRSPLFRKTFFPVLLFMVLYAVSLWAFTFSSVYVEDLKHPTSWILLRVVVVSAAMAAISLAVAYVTTRALLKPIKELSDVAARVAKGDLTARCDATRGDELGLLGAAINEMVGQLQENIRNLDAKIQERTRELARANRELREALSRREETERQLLASERKAHEASRAKTAFLANMSHELRTPLNAIIGYSEMLEEEAEDQGVEEFIADLNKIQTAGRHLLELIDDVLDLSKVEAGKMALFIETFEVASLVNDVRTTLAPAAERNGNQLRVHCPEGTGSMESDRTRVRQVLINLLSNACKFTEGGVVSLDVSRRSVNGHECVEFRVTDTGIGMTEDQLSKVFDTFTQADASTTRLYGGTGLGLALSRRLCRLLGGDIEAQSRPGEGSVFVARLPVRTPLPQESVSLEPVLPASPPVSANPPGAAPARRPISS